MNPNRAILSIGDEDWPFPVPIVRSNGQMELRPSETATEMSARRIGTDELDAIEICHGYVEAQAKYASEDRDKDGMLKYASHLMSTPGQHDGLYWEGASEPLVPRVSPTPHGMASGRGKPNRTTDIISGFSRGKAPMRQGEPTITSSRAS